MDFEEIAAAIIEGVKKLAKNAAKGFVEEAKADLEAFWIEAREDVERYTLWLSQGELTKVEYELLVQAKASNAKMLTLSAAGILKARIKHLLVSMRDLILNTVFAALPI